MLNLQSEGHGLKNMARDCHIKAYRRPLQSNLTA